MVNQNSMPAPECPSRKINVSVHFNFTFVVNNGLILNLPYYPKYIWARMTFNLCAGLYWCAVFTDKPTKKGTTEAFCIVCYWPWPSTYVQDYIGAQCLRMNQPIRAPRRPLASFVTRPWPSTYVQDYIGAQCLRINQLIRVPRRPLASFVSR